MSNRSNWLERMIEFELHELLQATESAELILFHQNRITTELKNTKKDIFKMVAVSASSKAEVKSLIRGHQKMILRLKDMLFEYDPDFWKNGMPVSRACVKSLVYTALQDLSEFLRAYFYKAYNKTEKQSAIGQELLRFELASAIQILESRFMPYKEEDFFEALISPLQNFMTKKPHRITETNAIYLHRYKTFLLELQVGVERAIVMRTCEETLFRYNVNSPKISHYFNSKIRKEMEACDSVQSRIKLLYSEAWRVSRLYSKSGTTYREGLPKLRDQITQWIYDEIDYLQREISMENILISTINSPRDNAINTKLPTRFSVYEIALFIRLLIESGIIPDDNIKASLKWASVNLQSKKTSEISHESLRSKYYDLPSVSLIQMEKYLNKMKDILKRMD